MPRFPTREGYGEEPDGYEDLDAGYHAPNRSVLEDYLDILEPISEDRESGTDSSRSSTQSELDDPEEVLLRQEQLRELQFKNIINADPPQGEEEYKSFIQEVKSQVGYYRDAYLEVKQQNELYREYRELKDLQQLQGLRGLGECIRQRINDIQSRLIFYKRKIDVLEQENEKFKREFERMNEAGYSRVDILKLDEPCEDEVIPPDFYAREDTSPDNDPLPFLERGTSRFHLEPLPLSGMTENLEEASGMIPREMKIDEFEEEEEEEERRTPRVNHLIPENYIETYEQVPSGMLTHIVDIKPVQTHIVNVRTVRDPKIAELVHEHVASGKILVKEFPGASPTFQPSKKLTEEVIATVQEAAMLEESREVILAPKPPPSSLLPNRNPMRRRNFREMKAADIEKIKAEVDARFEAMGAEEMDVLPAKFPKIEVPKIPPGNEVRAPVSSPRKKRIDSPIPRETGQNEMNSDKSSHEVKSRKNARLKSGLRRPLSQEKNGGIIKTESPLPDISCLMSPRQLPPLGQRPPTRRKDAPQLPNSQRNSHQQTVLGPIKSSKDTTAEKPRRADGEPAPVLSSIHFPFPPEKKEGLTPRKNPRWRTVVNRKDVTYGGPPTPAGAPVKHTYEPPKPKIMRGRPLVTPGLNANDATPKGPKSARSPELPKPSERRSRVPNNTHASQSHSNVALGPVKDSTRAASPVKKKVVSFDTVPQTVISQIDLEPQAPVPQIRRSPNRITRPPLPKKTPITPVDQLAELRSGEITLPKIVGSPKVLNNTPEKSVSSSRLSILQGGILPSRPLKPPTPTSRRLPTGVKPHFTPSPDKEPVRNGTTQSRSLSCVVECYAYEDENEEVNKRHSP